METRINKELGLVLYYNGSIFSIALNRFLKQSIKRNGYKKISVQGRTYSSHRLLAKAFIPNPHNKPQVNHLDGNKTNNWVSNFAWATASENARHAFDTGLSPIGENHGKAKFSNTQVSEMLKLRAKGKTYESIAKLYNTGKGTIHKIVKRKRKR